VLADREGLGSVYERRSDMMMEDEVSSHIMMKVRSHAGGR
jgi:hypothetical protein